ncbi:hypothetical protein N7537_009275 [Penicillium hordei]|uniref:Uncharacterized protein n=1 Tax=Penicillium hordei TaxID=40994 RepID=A0AAD6DSS1_9EURO|nr:uncharacterized protein N7537_009275 [Penicillium hordei]KAJ5592371.1 hypothetical protein N7537_009275 [Penicillium hordei]
MEKDHMCGYKPIHKFTAVHSMSLQVCDQDMDSTQIYAACKQLTFGEDSADGPSMPASSSLLNHLETTDHGTNAHKRT